MAMFFSATTRGFYPLHMRLDYIAAGTWPCDAVEMTDYEIETYWAKQAPSGKLLGGDDDGRPVWIDSPPLTSAELVEQAAEKKRYLIAEVESETAMLRAKLALGRINKDETASLNAWLDYLDKLDAVDTSTAPDINWPQQPAE